MTNLLKTGKRMLRNAPSLNRVLFRIQFKVFDYIKFPVGNIFVLDKIPE